MAHLPLPIYYPRGSSLYPFINHGAPLCTHLLTTALPPLPIYELLRSSLYRRIGQMRLFKKAVLICV